jgi:hypothetical protein
MGRDADYRAGGKAGKVDECLEMRALDARKATAGCFLRGKEEENLDEPAICCVDGAVLCIETRVC